MGLVTMENEEPPPYSPERNCYSEGLSNLLVSHQVKGIGPIAEHIEIAAQHPKQ